MKVLLNTDNHIQGDEALADRVQGVVEGALERFADQVTRVEVHLHDTNAGKPGDHDKHCLMEARLEGRPPVTAEADAHTVQSALSNAVHKLQRGLDRDLGKLGH